MAASQRKGGCLALPARMRMARGRRVDECPSHEGASFLPVTSASAVINTAEHLTPPHVKPLYAHTPPQSPVNTARLGSASELVLSTQTRSHRCDAPTPSLCLLPPPSVRSVAPFTVRARAPPTAVSCRTGVVGCNWGRREWVMFGAPVPKDLNLPAALPQPTTRAGARTTPPQQQMSSPGLLRYRSAPSTLLGEVMCGDQDFPAAGGGVAGHGPPAPDHAAADNVLARFLAEHHSDTGRDCKPPRPAAAHFMDEAAAAASMAASQQQQLMYQSQQQQQMAAMEGLYRNVSSGGTEHGAAAVGAANSLLRQSSSPAGFLNHLNMDTGYGSMLRAGMAGGGGGFRTNGVSDARLKGQLSFSSRQGSVMSQISEVGSEELDGGSSPEAAGSNAASGAPRGYSGIPGYPTMGGAWTEEPSPSPTSGSGAKRPRDSGPGPAAPLAPQLSLPSGINGGKPASAEMAAIEKFLQFQDAVPCKIRAKRGCATHPRSIAERVRRTKISERIRKLQELVPNMEKQTNTSDMLDLAVDYIKDLQKQVKVLNDGRANCTCSGV